MFKSAAGPANCTRRSMARHLRVLSPAWVARLLARLSVGGAAGVAAGAAFGSAAAGYLSVSHESRLPGSRYVAEHKQMRPLRRGGVMVANVQRPPKPGVNEDHPYENLVLAGGAPRPRCMEALFVQALDDAGVLPYLKRTSPCPTPVPMRVPPPDL